MRKRAAVAVAGPLRDSAGRERVSIDTVEKSSFAAACLMEWGAREGRDRMWMLRSCRSIDVPREIIEVVRVRFADKRKGKLND